MFGSNKTNDAGGGANPSPAGGLVAAIVAPGNTVMQSSAKQIGKDANGKPIYNVTTTYFGPGKIVYVSEQDLASLIAAKVVLNPNDVDPLGLAPEGPTVQRAEPLSITVG